MRLGDMVASQAPPGNLPLQPTSLIGRDEELAGARRALNKTRLLTLTGVGGVGKTRLALALAERVAESYPDGTWFVELAPLADATLVAQTVARIVSCTARARRRSSLRAGQLLPPDARHFLILDNCEHLLASCADAG